MAKVTSILPSKGSGISIHNNLQGLNLGDYLHLTANEKLDFNEINALNLPTTLNNFVPYIGATTNVDLGEHQVKAGQFELDQTPTGTFGVGKVRWNDVDGTIEVMLKGGNVTLQIGQEQVLRVVNKTGTNLLESQYHCVYISGAQGNRLKVDLALSNNTVNSNKTIGLVTENINNNSEGFVTTDGLVRNINTTGSQQSETWVDGDVLYLSAISPGHLTNVPPTSPNHKVVVGYVVRAHATQGNIFVKVNTGLALSELHDVKITSTTVNKVIGSTTEGLWENKTIPQLLGYTPVGSSGTINRIPKFNSSNTLIDSTILDTGNILIGTTIDNLIDKLQVAGSGALNSMSLTPIEPYNGTYLSLVSGYGPTTIKSNGAGTYAGTVIGYGIHNNIKFQSNGSTIFGNLFDDGSGALVQIAGDTTTHGLSLTTTPTTSAGGYDVLTRNTSTGKIEKISNSGNISIEKTKAEIDVLITSNGLIPGTLYKITGVHPTLYNDGVLPGTTIYLRALTNNTLSKEGYGEFWNPKYNQSVDGFGIWNTLSSYSINSKAIWGGYSWTNLTGSVGTKVDVLNLDIINWAKDSYDSNNYNKVIDIVEYDYVNDWIYRRYESKSSNDVFFTKNDNLYFINNIQTEFSAISVFMFGNIFNNLIGSLVGIKNQKIINAYNENINFSGGFQINLTFEPGSYQKDLVFGINSLQDTITFKQGSYQNNIVLGLNVFQQFLIFGEWSKQTSITFDEGSFQDTLTFEKDSYQSGLIFGPSSFQEKLTFGKNSRQFSLTFGQGSSQQNLVFNLSSYQSYLTFEPNSYQIYLKFGINSHQTGITIPANAMMRRITFENSAFIDSVDYSNSTLVFENYAKTIYTRPDGLTKIRYYNNFDTMVIADITD